MQKWQVYLNQNHPMEQKQGEIVMQLECSEEEANGIAAMEDYYSVFWGEAIMETQYYDIDSQTVLPKQTLNLSVNKDTMAADGVDEVVISGIPFPFAVMTTDMETLYLLDDDSIEFTTNQPGQYGFIFESARYMWHEETINAI